MTRAIILPDDGQAWVAAPKVATVAQMLAVRSTYATPDQVYADMLAAAPPCKVVELPERMTAKGITHIPSAHAKVIGWNDCLDEIERRAKANG